MPLTLSCAFATSLETPEHARIAEQLGYVRAWFYDSPSLYPDVWVQLCRAADCTRRISLATGVIVPHLRTPMTNAAAIATLVSAAGQERVVIGIGSGFTARVSMGQRPLTWRYVGDYTRALRALLRGEVVEWDGGVMQMMHWEGYGARRPIEVPFVFAAGGPKGVAVARELGQGVFSAFAAQPGFDWNVVLLVGTVLEEGESPGSARAIAAAGHGGAVIFHYALEHRMLGMIAGGEDWRRMYEAMPERTRHLAMHDGHLVGVNARDERFVTGEFLARHGLALDRAAWRDRLAALEAEGATEIAFQPAGPDIPRELEAFASLVG
ncbi:MAG: LLM class flavin-dependent oxidoreductase [Gammaproteobacteria bacterium]|nr:LLM class flavin-dependent oxidoreductase [Gammaproteobacteria bacterium]